MCCRIWASTSPPSLSVRSSSATTGWCVRKLDTAAAVHYQLSGARIVLCLCAQRSLCWHRRGENSSIGWSGRSDWAACRSSLPTTRQNGCPSCAPLLVWCAALTPPSAILAGKGMTAMLCSRAIEQVSTLQRVMLLRQCCHRALWGLDHGTHRLTAVRVLFPWHVARLYDDENARCYLWLPESMLGLCTASASALSWNQGMYTLEICSTAELIVGAGNCSQHSRIAADRMQTCHGPCTHSVRERY